MRWIAPEMLGNLLDVPRVDARVFGGLDVVEEIAGAAVNHGARCTGGAAREIAHLAEHDLDAALREVARQARAVGSAPDNENVGLHFFAGTTVLIISSLS